MKRLAASLQLDFSIQWRNRLYSIGIGLALVAAFLLTRFVASRDMFKAIPILMLLVVGGSTLLYVAALLLFEKDEGTLAALSVSPLSIPEYLLSKVLSLTALATLESLILVGVATRFEGFNLVILVLGIVLIGIMYTLLGIVMIVRYESITDFFVPLLLVAMILQLPFLHFLGVWENNLLLIIPTSAPTLLMQGAFIELEVWQWVYALLYTLVVLIGLAFWAVNAFERHIILKERD